MLKHPIQPGDVVYHTDEEGWYLVYKILFKETEDTFLMRCYWPSAEQPSSDNWQELDVRTTCESAQLPTDVFVLTNEAVSLSDEEAMTNFRRIRTGIEIRKTYWQTLLSEAETCVRENRWEDAIERCTECASYVKYEARVFQLRGHALLQLERYSEAIADLEHALTIDAQNEETLYDCSLAYLKSGNYSKAKEKMAFLAQVETTSEKAQLLNRLLSEN